ncbi:MAG TPA: hypothetical protein VK574_12830 [Terracidiphilus sp.]|nr:hypothetical protein [Terracidiphilus sp.]
MSSEVTEFPCLRNDFLGLVPHPVAAGFHLVSLAVRPLFFALLVWIVIQGSAGKD